MERRVKRYVILSYVVFWFMVLGLCGTASMVFHCPPVIMRILSNVIVMTGLCFIMNYFMEKNDNLVYGIVVHFCFNFLYCFLQVDILFYVVLSLVYVGLIVLICYKRAKETQCKYF